jgi:hypothetical protein
LVPYGCTYEGRDWGKGRDTAAWAGEHPITITSAGTSTAANLRDLHPISDRILE